VKRLKKGELKFPHVLVQEKRKMVDRHSHFLSTFNIKHMQIIRKISKWDH